MSSPADDHDWLLAERRALGDRIRDIRRRRELTQEQVFLAIPLSRSQYQEIESGQGNATTNTLLCIARVLRVPASELFR